MFGDKLKEAPFSRYYYYKGTNTFPPCDGPVTWYVMEEVYNIDKDDYKTIREQIIKKVEPATGNEKPP